MSLQSLMVLPWISFVLVVVSYVTLHGLVALTITPVQNLILFEVYVYASLIYFPHGISILATVILGWKAVLPLLIGSMLAITIFSPDLVNDVKSLRLHFQYAFIGATSPLVSLELFRRFREGFQSTAEYTMSWKDILLIGAVSSVFNAIALGLIFNDAFSAQNVFAIQLTAVVGNMIGLIATLLAVMMVFRWARLTGR